MIGDRSIPDNLVKFLGPSGDYLRPGKALGLRGIRRPFGSLSLTFEAVRFALCACLGFWVWSFPISPSPPFKI